MLLPVLFHLFYLSQIEVNTIDYGPIGTGILGSNKHHR
jgi:hypothetical protein